jgi:hypothetical protein
VCLLVGSICASKCSVATRRTPIGERCGRGLEAADHDQPLLADRFELVIEIFEARNRLTSVQGIGLDIAVQRLHFVHDTTPTKLAERERASLLAGSGRLLAT